MFVVVFKDDEQWKLTRFVVHMFARRGLCSKVKDRQQGKKGIRPSDDRLRVVKTRNWTIKTMIPRIIRGKRGRKINEKRTFDHFADCNLKRKRSVACHRPWYTLIRRSSHSNNLDEWIVHLVSNYFDVRYRYQWRIEGQLNVRSSILDWLKLPPRQTYRILILLNLLRSSTFTRLSNRTRIRLIEAGIFMLENWSW